MSAIRTSARGGRDAKRFAKHERFTDSLYDQGVLTRPEDARAKALTARGLVIDDEFKALIPPQTAEENDALEQSILAEGCRDPLVIWKEQNILVDGHHRYEICIKHSLSYNVRDKSFDSREDAMLWMIQNQLSRRNIIPHMRVVLLGKANQAIADKAKQQMSSGGKGYQNSDNPTHTLKEVAKIANTSHDTVHKVNTIERTAPAPIRQKARSGEMSTNRAYLVTKSLQDVSSLIIDFVTERSIDEVERVEILKRLEKSAGSPESNGTFDEVMRTGGFTFGEAETDRIKDFATAPIQSIQRGLDAIARSHAIIGAQASDKPFTPPVETPTVAATASPFTASVEWRDGSYHAVIVMSGYTTETAAMKAIKEVQSMLIKEQAS